VLCSLAGIGGLIRQHSFYGFATLALASLQCSARTPSVRRPPSHRTLVSDSSAIQNSLGLLLFVFGGGLLFITNFLRFGSGWEFGHRLNVSSAVPSIYSTL